MFLALKELKKEKKRFILIISVIVLIAYLVYFLSSLAFGLAQINRTAVDHWKGSHIVVTKSSDANIYASMIDVADAQAQGYDASSYLNVVNANVYVDGYDDATSLVFIGGDFERIMPTLIEGMLPKDPLDIVISKSIKSERNVELGSIIKHADTGREFKVVGFSAESNFNTVPVAYAVRTSITPAMMMYTTNDPDVDVNASATPNMPDRLSALLIDEPSVSENKAWMVLSKTEFINKLPGYNAQVLTFGLMIISLSIIASVIMGIFMYILTIQKRSIFAVLKIQGFQSGYIMRSILFQVVLLVFVGLMIGFGLTALTIGLLPSTVPVSYNWTLVGIVSGFIVLTSLCGALFSAWSVLKIDPLDAL